MLMMAMLPVSPGLPMATVVFFIMASVLIIKINSAVAIVMIVKSPACQKPAVVAVINNPTAISLVVIAQMLLSFISGKMMLVDSTFNRLVIGFMALISLVIFSRLGAAASFIASIRSMDHFIRVALLNMLVIRLSVKAFEGFIIPVCHCVYGKG